MNLPRFESLLTGITLMSIEADRRSLELLILELLSERDPHVTICPSEVARAASTDNWRVLMPAVRTAASRLAGEGTIVISQGGIPIAPETTWRGPVRLGRGKAWGRMELLVARGVRTQLLD